MTTRWRRLVDFVRSKLAWGRVYRASSYLKSALWTVPLIAIALELLLSPLIRALDTWQRWYLAGLSLAGATALYQTVITMTLSFLVFTFGSLLVAIQVAGGQLTPRIIATTLLRNNVVRYSVGLFVFTLVFALGAGLAGLGGVVAAPFLGVYPDMAMEFLLQAFIVVVIGGLGSVPGAAVGALLVGLARAYGDHIVLAGIQLPWMTDSISGSPAIARASTVLIMAIVLFIKPTGIFGKKE